MDGRIVVGVDGSPSSRSALRWAVEEAGFRRTEVEAVLVWHVDNGMVIGPISADLAAGTDPERACDDWRAVLDDVVAEIGAETGAEIRTVLAEGDPREVLTKASADAALLVVGTRGVGLIREVLLGSVSSYCVHHAHCPVVVIREPKPERTEPKPVLTPGPLL
ncbi:nucleotide-binding universal stress UspA family protein [Saccharothrix tamanrassetensis]|uniref:Nucleotide-binding universal stress UspA family protein n=1 Tax=Saccharothrix tamanrassetensis TaxID=1051531 RepID=A0A841CWX1_9PSEU|nr:universal stress protein [Saccharothrix tamanrassetensis]MBB5960445.1 nucleotide-binding universal stress UspA family protein [Saccharothrix tamanrassetensis]